MTIFIFFPDLCVLKRVLLFEERRDVTATSQSPSYMSRHTTPLHPHNHHRPPDLLTD
jgi:hypothetical protein